MSELLLRTANLELVENRVEGIVAPFDQIATVTDDHHPDIDGTTTYREVFRAGSFSKMIRGLAARNWFKAISLNLDHKPDVDHTIGYATRMEEMPSGVFASFELYDDSQLDKIKAMIRSSHDGMSVGFHPAKNRVVGDLVERLVVHFNHVAVTPIPAYAGATVTAVRDLDLANLPDLPTPNLDALQKELEALRG